MTLQRLGPFELLRILGRGGMGTVYEARETGSKTLVAVKALSPQFSFDDRFRNRFEGEIDALMKLEHKNIVRLLSYGQDEGNLFFAMELVDGCSLFQEQKKGQVFHWREIIDIGKQVSAGLRHAHDRGIIHRDLKPGNLMIDKNRHVKITDFGIAKSFGSHSLTREGNVLGTMDYMSPEQARGEVVTARSDLFSLGAVLYALLSGRPPFLQETVEQTFELLLSNRPPVQLHRVATDTPLPLASLIHRLLEKAPEKRLATAMATGRQLQHVEDAIQGSNDCDTQVVDPASNASDVQLGETFAAESHGNADPETPISGEVHSDETRVTDGGELIAESLSKKPDYFNEVTPQQRLRSVTAKGVENRSNPWPLVIALAGVIAICMFGVWFAVIRSPGAEQLLATIRESERQPYRVQKELELFMKKHPEHEQIVYVQELGRLAEAIRLRNNLQLKQRLPRSEMTAIENQFLVITSIKSNESPQARDKMRAFLALYSEKESLEESDSRVIEAAGVFLKRIEQDAELQIQNNLESIKDMMGRADRITNPQNALQIYRLVVEMYEKDSWAMEHVDKANREINRIESESGNSNQ